jgi:hypothetical protein
VKTGATIAVERGDGVTHPIVARVEQNSEKNIAFCSDPAFLSARESLDCPGRNADRTRIFEVERALIDAAANLAILPSPTILTDSESF